MHYGIEGHCGRFYTQCMDYREYFTKPYTMTMEGMTRCHVAIGIIVLNFFSVCTVFFFYLAIRINLGLL